MSAEDLDDAVIDYYSTRVPDPQEVLWRADYTRAHALRSQAEDALHPYYAQQLRAQADAIQQRYDADPAVAARWSELSEIHTALPERESSQAEFPDLVVSVRPAGMDGVSWRSQLQARDIAGHGRWPDTVRSALADYQPGSSLSEFLAGSGAERDGAER
jgi:hypothetical protein